MSRMAPEDGRCVKTAIDHRSEHRPLDIHPACKLLIDKRGLGSGGTGKGVSEYANS